MALTNMEENVYLRDCIKNKQFPANCLESKQIIAKEVDEALLTLWALLESNEDPLEYTLAQHLIQNQLIIDVLAAYKEILGFSPTERPLPSSLPSLDNLFKTHTAQLFRGQDGSFFPSAAYNIRDEKEVSECYKSPLVLSHLNLVFVKLLSDIKPRKGVVFVSCSHDYFANLAQIQLSNILRTSTDLIYHINVIGEFVDPKVASLFVKYNNVVLTNTPECLNSRLTGVPYYAACRHIIQPIIMQIYQLPLLSIGADELFFKDIACVFDDLGNDFGLCYAGNGHKKPWSQAQADFYYIPNSLQGLKFLTGVSNYIVRNANNWGWLDQLAIILSATYVKFTESSSVIRDLRSYVRSGVVIDDLGAGLDSITKMKLAEQYIKDTPLKGQVP
jgi:hypothetical protein